MHLTTPDHPASITWTGRLIRADPSGPVPAQRAGTHGTGVNADSERPSTTADLPRASIGTPETWRLTDVWPLDTIPKPVRASLTENDFYFCRLACLFRPEHEETRIEWARFTLSLLPTTRDASPSSSISTHRYHRRGQAHPDSHPEPDPRVPERRRQPWQRGLLLRVHHLAPVIWGCWRRREHRRLELLRNPWPHHPRQQVDACADQGPQEHQNAQRTPEHHGRHCQPRRPRTGGEQTQAGHRSEPGHPLAEEIQRRPAARRTPAHKNPIHDKVYKEQSTASKIPRARENRSHPAQDADDESMRRAWHKLPYSSHGCVTGATPKSNACGHRRMQVRWVGAQLSKGCSLRQISSPGHGPGTPSPDLYVSACRINPSQSLSTARYRTAFG
jgi:hypothetical protein